MRKGHRSSVRRGVEGQGFRLVAAGVAALALAGCTPMISSQQYGEGPWDYTRPTAEEMKVAKSDFSVELIRFSDLRLPKVNDASDAPEKYLYRYDPDRLMHGVSTQMPMLMEKYIGYKAKRPKNYKLELELRQMDTDIRTGNLFSGGWGRYNVVVDMVAMVRRGDDSSVVLRHRYRLNLEARRGTTSGRGPTMQEDRDALYNMVDNMLRKISVRIGRELIGGDARDWDVKDGAQQLEAKIRLVPEGPPGERAPMPSSGSVPQSEDQQPAVDAEPVEYDTLEPPVVQPVMENQPVVEN